MSYNYSSYESTNKLRCLSCLMRLTYICFSVCRRSMRVIWTTVRWSFKNWSIQPNRGALVLSCSHLWRDYERKWSSQSTAYLCYASIWAKDGPQQDYDAWVKSNRWPNFNYLLSPILVTRSLSVSCNCDMLTSLRTQIYRPFPLIFPVLHWSLPFASYLPLSLISAIWLPLMIIVCFDNVNRKCHIWNDESSHQN